MTCPVNVSPSGGYPDGRTRRRGQDPAEPLQVSNAASSSTGTMVGEDPAPCAACRHRWLARMLVGFAAVGPDASVVPVSL
jgi:hypothetical protein